MSLVRPLMAGVLLLAASTSAIGPPNGTAGTLDFRYPDYIVEPLVECPFEGYFPHPRDNTWFYRCYDRYGSSFFWRAYFQCQPCTVFSDALDQCVFQETGTKCLPPPDPCRTTFEACQLVQVCPAPNSNRAVLIAIEACFKTSVVCPGQPDKPLCQDGYVYDRTNGQCRVGTPESRCLPHSFQPTPPLTPPPTTQPTPPQPTTTKRTPTDVNDYIDNFFVCELPGSRPSAEGYWTLGCSDSQFCNSAGFPMMPIIACEFYLECDTSTTGGLQLVQKQCPAGQFYLYRFNSCGGQGQLDLYDCTSLGATTTHQPTPPTTTTPQPTSTTTTEEPQTTPPLPPATTLPEPTPPTTTTTTQAPSTIPPPIYSANDCTFEFETLGMEGDEVREHCHTPCGSNGLTQDIQRYCDLFYQCLISDETNKVEVTLKPCPAPSQKFDRYESTCIETTHANFGDCIMLTTSATPTCTYLGQLPTNIDRLKFQEGRCNDQRLCSDGIYLGTQTTCENFYQCLFHKSKQGVLWPQRQTCDDSTKKFDKKTRRCVTPQTKICLSDTTSYIGSNAIRKTPALFTPNTSGGFNQVNPHQPAQHHAAVSFQHPAGLPPKSNIGLRPESPFPSNHPSPFGHNVLRLAQFGPKHHTTLSQGDTVGRISSSSPGYEKLAGVGFDKRNLI